MSGLTVADVRFAHPGGAEMRFDFALPAAARLALVGPSGSGKSTLLHLIAGFETPIEGGILFDGVPLAGLAPGLRPVTTVFQDNNLFAHLSMAQNAGLGLAPRLRLTADEKTRVADALAAVGLTGKESRLPGALSGGERQRAVLARAMLRARPVLLLDEPFSSLGPGLRGEMLDLVLRLQGETGMTVVMATHHIDDALRFSTHAGFVEEGRLTALLSPSLLAAPPPGSALERHAGLRRPG